MPSSAATTAIATVLRRAADRLAASLLIATAGLLSACAPLPPAAPPATAEPPRVFPPPPDEPRFVHERTLRSSLDVRVEAPADGLRRFVTGEQSTGEALVKPYAVAVWRGRVYVSDTVTRYVRVYDVAQGRHDRLGDEEGEGQLVKPLGLDVDAEGRLYVADIGQRAILVYGPDRRFLRRIGGPSWFSRLTSVTVDPAGTKVYAVDLGGVSSDQHRVRVFDARTGVHLQDIGRRGTGPGEFNLPRDLAIGRDGRLYVVDGGNFRVLIFDAQGRPIGGFGSVGLQYGQFARPKEVAVDRDGNVYVVDTAFGNVQIFDPDGALLMFIGGRSERDGPANYMLPSGVAVDEDGRLYVVDQWFRKIEVYRPVGLGAGQGYLVAPTAPAAPGR